MEAHCAYRVPAVLSRVLQLRYGSVASLSNAHANRRPGSQSFEDQHLTTSSPPENPSGLLSRPVAFCDTSPPPTLFSRRLLEGSRFIAWQLDRSASKRLPRTSAGVFITTTWSLSQEVEREVRSELVQKFGKDRIVRITLYAPYSPF